MSDEMRLMPALSISASGLDAQKRRMEVIANNVANASTTRGADGKVFRRKEVVFAAKLANALGGSSNNEAGRGVNVDGVVDDIRPGDRIYRPGHPDADKDGYLMMPNVSIVEEMVDMLSATRAYEANLAVIKASKDMANKALEIGR